MLELGHSIFPGVGDRAPDPGGVSRFVHEMADLGVDIVKLSLSGESAVVHGTSRVLQFTELEVAAAGALAQARDRVFVAPTPGIIWAHLHDQSHPPEPGMEVTETAASVKVVAAELKARGVRLGPGGDYGFWVAHTRPP